MKKWFNKSIQDISWNMSENTIEVYTEGGNVVSHYLYLMNNIDYDLIKM